MSATGGRFVVGIDLGTTNCALAAAEVGGAAPAAVAIPQLVGPGELAARPTLPSFLLLPTALEVAPAAMALPWAPDAVPDAAVGAMARDRGAELPHRLVSSAKSWLSNTGVDRTAAILPWRGVSRDAGDGKDGDGDDGGGAKVSPVEASARYLGHLRAIWDAAHPDAPLAEQDVFVTVPASFDPVARELTVAAAHAAGLPHLTLLEEPQAAFYSWLAQRGERWRDDLRAGDVVVVIDVGGGTSDFSLIEVSDDGGGNLVLERIAVGDHILLGGDNMDLALAMTVQQRLGDRGKDLRPTQQRALVHACRRAKEVLLGGGDGDDGGSPPDAVPVSILGRGSKLIGGTLRAEVTRADVERLLLDGFFPAVAADARPAKRRTVGLQELGLPYAHDAALTRHLAEFLARSGRRPTAVLWNGGVMKAGLLRERVAEVMASWFGGAPIRSLVGTDLDLAVAHGAAAYGLVRRGRGVRIRGGTARAYYIGIESAMPAIPGFAPPLKALCVAPLGMEEGSAIDLPGEALGLVVGESATFRFFASAGGARARAGDVAGALIDVPDAGDADASDGDDRSRELIELDPVETTLAASAEQRAGEVVPVVLQSKITEVGTLELWCHARSGDRRWKLEYSVREGEPAPVGRPT